MRASCAADRKRAKAIARIHAGLSAGLAAAGLPDDAIQLVPVTDRAAVGAMLRATGLIDIIVPRGGKGLVARVQEEARVPVLAHLDGINHLYIDRAADPAKAAALAVNAKLRRTGVCGATETLLIDTAFADPAPILAALADAGCELRGDAAVCAIEARAVPATAEDWDTEYLDAIIAVAFVDGIAGALAHIDAHGSHHTDAIVTEDAATAERFLAEVRFGDRDVERLDPVRRWRRIRARCGDRDLDRSPACARPGRAGGAHDLQVAGARHGAGAALNAPA